MLPGGADCWVYRLDGEHSYNLRPGQQVLAVMCHALADNHRVCPLRCALSTDLDQGSVSGYLLTNTFSYASITLAPGASLAALMIMADLDVKRCCILTDDIWTLMEQVCHDDDDDDDDSLINEMMLLNFG
jgi:hypothetical protein